ncbi:rifin PIR protein, putative [Plasmodium reichenowi]|uniref:Rifin PIR protein, putative n=1 Tax=Plasmodium reichenowi TaxID=5854 RepID=A0A2P9DKW1_PLARE|nr:rifin PIR protein, putative [Plasmodium reichenowi]
MKVHCINILFFALPLNILEHNENKTYITPHHIQTNRSLCECDIQSSINDKDADIKSVKENFDRQTSQRFEEYDERMKHKRQKRKEERDKKIQEIIEKDKMEKSLAEKVEKGCLMCGCGLGGVAASVGIFGAVAVKELTKSSMIAATNAGIKAGVEVGLENVTKLVTKALEGQLFRIPPIEVLQKITEGKFTDGVTLPSIFKCINNNIDSQLYNTYDPFFTTVKNMAAKPLSDFNSDFFQEAVEAVKKAFADAKEGVLTEGAIKTSSLTTGITASVVAIVVIILIMVIIYLILRYRRKKKLKKKAQYTKLLNQ